jgi:hypothetical protein
VARYLNAALIVLLLVTAIGCSSSGGSNTPTGSGHPAASGTQLGASSTLPASFCSSVASLKSSVRELKQTNVNKTDLKQLKTSITAVGKDIRNVLNSAMSQYPSEISAIKTDYQSLLSSINIAIENPTYPTIAQVKTNFTTLWNVVGHFVATTAASC